MRLEPYKTENGKTVTKSLQHLQNFVNALAFPGQKMLKQSQKAFADFINAIAFSGLKMLKHSQNP